MTPKHTIFGCDGVAGDALFGGDNCTGFLRDLLNGNITTLRELVDDLMRGCHHAM